MTLNTLGYNKTIEDLRKHSGFPDLDIGRVVAEYRERYIVKTEKGDVEAEITGNLRFTAQGREDFPAVGDWVMLLMYENGAGIIHSILPRSTTLSRQAVGQFGEEQIITTNIDYALIVQAVDRDYNTNRLDRYLTICYASSVQPIIVLTKTDLIDKKQKLEITKRIRQRIKDVPIMAISNKTQEGYIALKEQIQPGMTYCMLGSSGVGKSTLINNLSGKPIMKTDEISQHSNRGKHVTTHRELIVLESGGILIDNPGMREVGISDSSGGLEMTFDAIAQLAQHCKYKDCTHTNESGCAVIEAVGQRKLNETAYENYLKMEKERKFFETSVMDRRRREKVFGKILKDYHKKNVKGKRN